MGGVNRSSGFHLRHQGVAHPPRLGYYDNYLVDNPSCVIVGVQGTAARMSQETVAAQDMITRFAEWQGREPQYGGRRYHLRQWRVPAMVAGAGHHSLYHHAGQHIRQEETARSTARSGLPSRKATAISAPQGSNSTTVAAVLGIALPTSEPANAVVRVRKDRNALAQPSAVLPSTCMTGSAARTRVSQHARVRQRTAPKKVEALFAELKNQIGLRRLRLRKLKFIREQFFLAAYPEHQATGPLPQPRAKTNVSRDDVVPSRREEKLTLPTVRR